MGEREEGTEGEGARERESECRYIGDVVSERRMERLEGDGSRRSATILRSLNLALAITCVQRMANMRQCAVAHSRARAAWAIAASQWGEPRALAHPVLFPELEDIVVGRGFAGAAGALRTHEVPHQLVRRACTGNMGRFARWGARRWQPFLRLLPPNFGSLAITSL
jgi:hypothetical protein